HVPLGPSSHPLASGRTGISHLATTRYGPVDTGVGTRSEFGGETPVRLDSSAAALAASEPDDEGTGWWPGVGRSRDGRLPGRERLVERLPALAQSHDPFDRRDQVALGPALASVGVDGGRADTVGVAAVV